MKEIHLINIADKNYPKSLRKIKDAPKILYYSGLLPDESKALFAIVGTRRPSSYGQQATLQIADELADAGITIVSGMAPGIDTFAHKVAIEKNMPTVAVLGTGLDEKSIYPQENIALSRKIIETGGCLISELPPGTRGTKFTFPKRNRIVSGLALGVLVIEAKEKSGSLITANYAKQQGKKVFAVPGQIFTLNAKGPNKLIKEGATLVNRAQDILDVLGVVPQTITKHQTFAVKNPTELAILTALKEGSLYIDKIIEKTKLSPPVIGSTLVLMEISGKVKNLGGNTYSLN